VTTPGDIGRGTVEPALIQVGGQRPVAAVAEQSSDAACRVVVIDVEPTRLRRVIAQRTVAALLAKDSLVFVVCDA
jgi:hypothetical protein